MSGVMRGQVDHSLVERVRRVTFRANRDIHYLPAIFDSQKEPAVFEPLSAVRAGEIIRIRIFPEFDADSHLLKPLPV